MAAATPRPQVAGLVDDLEGAVALEGAAQAAADEVVVVDQEHADRQGVVPPSVTLTRVPVGTWWTALKRAPSLTARSCMAGRRLCRP
jgi:hypothetical protein